MEGLHMKKKIRIAIAATTAVAILTGGIVYASGRGIKKSIQVIMNGINLVVDGQTIMDDNILYDGTTYVPIRAVAESLGKEVKWDAETYTAEISDKDKNYVEKNGIRVYAKAIKYKDEYTEVNIKIPVIEGMENSELMAQLNQEFEKKALDFKKESERITKEVAEESKEQGWPLRTGSVYIEYEAQINDNRTMSISVIYYQYTGGAHGNSNKETVNLDLVNEKELSLRDLFDGSEDYKEILTKEILKQMNNDKDNLFPETLKDFKASDDLKFYLTDEGIVFYFNPYEVAPYASGIVEYKISYDSLRDVLNKNYMQQFLNN